VNRKLVLSCIRKHLAELDADPTVVRPLGEIVPRIAQEIRSHRNGTVPKVHALPVSIVAAFVDGNASDEEEQAVCEAILVDNSILAEITATIRAESQIEYDGVSQRSRLPQLSSSLSDRLLKLVPSAPVAEPNLPNTPTEKTRTDSIQLARMESTEPVRSAAVPVWFLWSSLAVVAAAVTVAVWLGSPPPNHPVQPDVTKNSTFDSLPNDTNVVDVEPDSSKSSEPVTPRNQPSQSEKETSIVNAQALPETDSSLAMPDALNTQQKNAEEELAPKSIPKLEIQPKTYANDNSKDQVRPTSLRWSKIQGLLARQQANESVAGSQIDKWRGTSEGHTEDLPINLRQVLRLKTFPGSHAQASLATGGRLVLNSDSTIEIKSNDGKEANYITLEQGAVALVDFPKGTRMEIGYGGDRLATFEWETRASVVLGGTPAGLQSQIVGGSVRLNDKTYKSATLSIDRNHAKELKSTSRQLPTWVNRPTETPSISKAVLGQLAQSDDLGESINQLMKTNNGRALDELTRSHLLGWRSTLEEEDLFLSLGNRGPVLRALAFKRALQLPAWSPKWQEFWPKLERSVGDAAKVTALKNAVALAQSGTRMNLDQAIQTVSAMDTEDRACRVLTDLLLRQLVGNGPAYNADATNVENSRSMGLWRRYINATINRP
jgi:hypothetical protein